VADVDKLKKVKKINNNTRGTSLMGCGCHVSNDQVNEVGVQNCQRIKT